MISPDELPEASGIYCIKHKATDRPYVGQAENVRRRLRGHLKAARQNSDTHIHRAIRHYGAEAFHVEVLELCEPSLLNERESYWIKTLCALNGFNCTWGGGKRSRVVPSKDKSPRRGKRFDLEVVRKRFEFIERSRAAGIPDSQSIAELNSRDEFNPWVPQ